MKLLSILIIFISVTAYAGEDCVFDETAYTKFITKYNSENSNSNIEPDGRTLLVNRDGEKIIVKGGGCDHLGVAIELKTKRAFTEEQFLQKTLGLAVEFGNWLINAEALKYSIKKRKYKIINGTYYINIDALTVFSASYDDQGNINIDFYIN